MSSRNYIVEYSIDGSTKLKLIILPSVAKKILIEKRKSINQDATLISLDNRHTCTLAQVKKIYREYDESVLEDSTKIMAELDREELTEKQLREGWHRALCIALAHGLSRESGIIKKYCMAYDMDTSALYPIKCPVCQNPQ